MADIKQSEASETGVDTPTAAWAGFAEIDRAIAENRMTSYRWKKAWADPVSRNMTIGVLFVISAGFAFLVGAGLHWW